MSIFGGDGGVQFLVELNGREELRYHFDTIAEAMETLEFLRDFFPQGRFVIEPALH